MRALRLPLNPTDTVGELSVGLQQRVEILKALHRGADVLILDEPTAVLTPHETDELFDVIRRIVAEKGMTVILITHKLGEVMQLSDRVGVMRRGKLLGVLNTAETDEKALAAMMVGRDVLFDELREGLPGTREVLKVAALSARDDRGLPAVRGVSLTVHEGEIVGVCGVEGNGQTELTECIMGMRPQTGGSVTLNGKSITNLDPRAIRGMGVSWIPEDRLRTGLSEQATVTENLLVASSACRRSAFSACITANATRAATPKSSPPSSTSAPAGWTSPGAVSAAATCKRPFSPANSASIRPCWSSASPRAAWISAPLSSSTKRYWKNATRAAPSCWSAPIWTSCSASPTGW